jgi:site-specific recombinase XerD
MQDDYSTQSHKKYTVLLRELLKELPDFCAEFFRGIDSRTTALTRYAYATDLSLFFTYLISEHKKFVHRNSTADFVISDLDLISPTDIEMYLDYLSLYTRVVDENEISTINQERAKARKLASMRSLYKYFYKKEKIFTTPPAMVDLPKLHEKPIIRLDANEIVDILTACDNSEGLTPRQIAYNQNTRVRDIAILTLFLGTGIRISELVGIDIDDINFVSNEFAIIRKGGKRDVLVFGIEVRSALLEYLLLREKMKPKEEHENALFLSLQMKRITVRAVENMVKKFARAAVPQKNITPHKLRSTFGTMLYAETGDIYLVADVLGHKDVNTTKRHYADISRERRRIAAEVITLREYGKIDKS